MKIHFQYSMYIHGIYHVYAGPWYIHGIYMVYTMYNIYRGSRCLIGLLARDIFKHSEAKRRQLPGPWLRSETLFAFLQARPSSELVKHEWHT